MIADLYIRVSTDEQADKGYSQRDQEERLRKYCQIQHVAIRKIIFEDHSAKTFNRPRWVELLSDLKRRKGQVDIILFTKWDRFSRNAGDAYQMIGTLRKLGVEPQAVEQPLDLSVPENKMMLAFYLAAPEVENDRRALNVIYGMRRAKKEGRWMGRAPIGYINKVTENGRKFILPNEPEAGIMRWVFNTLASGQYTVEQIYKEAKSKGIRLARSNFWMSLRNPIYCGKILIKSFKDEAICIVPGVHEPIISESMFYDVQDYLDGKKKNFRTKIEGEDIFQLRGYLICPKCGKLLTASASRGNGGKYNYYHCGSVCGTRFKAENANELFIRELCKYIPRPGMDKVYSSVINTAYKIRTKAQRTDIASMTDQINTASNDIAKARRLLLKEEIDASDFRAIKAENERKISALEAKLIEISETTTNIQLILDKAVGMLSRIGELYKDGDVRTKRSIIGSIYPEKLIFDGFQYRTNRINEAVRIIYLLDKAFHENKTGQTKEDIDLSCLVPRTGFEPAHGFPRCDLNTVRLPVSPSGHLFHSGLQI
jgi:site-specific DNA recombinase